MLCKECGSTINENAIICPKCGYSTDKKNNVIALLLCFFLGTFGVHRFYVGKIGSGITMFILTITIIGAIVTAIWEIIDFIMIVCNKFTDKKGKKLSW